MNNEEEKELKDVKKWVTSLSLERLLSAMEFPCAHLQENSSTLITGASTARRKRNKISYSYDSKTTNEFKDFDILKQMVQLQAPLPTPIHPK